MMDFGYSINKSSTIQIDQTDKTAARKLLEIEPSFATCIGCGTCMASCSAGVFVKMNLRKLQLQVARGINDTINSEIKNCMLCGKCQMLCPRGINTRNVLLAINKIFK